MFPGPSLISSSSSISVLTILLSDRSAVLCSVPLSDVEDRSPRWRFDMSLLGGRTFIASLGECIGEFIGISVPSGVDPEVLWEATGCAVRGFCVCFSSALAKARAHLFTQLEGGIQSLQGLRRRHFAEQRASQLSSLKEECGLLSHSRAEFVLHRTGQECCFESETPSHWPLGWRSASLGHMLTQ